MDDQTSGYEPSHFDVLTSLGRRRVECTYRRNGWAVTECIVGDGTYVVTHIGTGASVALASRRWYGRMSHELAIGLCRFLGDRRPQNEMTWAAATDGMTHSELVAFVRRSANWSEIYNSTREWFDANPSAGVVEVTHG